MLGLQSLYAELCDILQYCCFSTLWKAAHVRLQNAQSLFQYKWQKQTSKTFGGVVFYLWKKYIFAMINQALSLPSPSLFWSSGLNSWTPTACQWKGGSKNRNGFPLFPKPHHYFAISVCWASEAELYKYWGEEQLSHVVLGPHTPSYHLVHKYHIFPNICGIWILPR